MTDINHLEMVFCNKDQYFFPINHN